MCGRWLWPLSLYFSISRLFSFVWVKVNVCFRSVIKRFQYIKYIKLCNLVRVCSLKLVWFDRSECVMISRENLL